MTEKYDYIDNKAFTYEEVLCLAYQTFEKADPPLTDADWEQTAAKIADDLGLKWKWADLGGIMFYR